MFPASRKAIEQGLAVKGTEMKKYLRSLNRHPGVPIAAALMPFGFVAGAKADDWVVGGLVGAAIMCIFWLPVLWTAWEARHEAN